MTNVTIKWRAVDEETGMTTDSDTSPEWRETILPDSDWVDCQENAESAVGEILRRWFTNEEWVRWYPDDQTHGVVVVTVDSPLSIAGNYGCDLARVVHTVITALA